MLLTWHNLHYYQEVMQGLRGAIEAGILEKFVADFHAQRNEDDAGDA
jgi:queuine tRNA-ribosyltransferase